MDAAMVASVLIEDYPMLADLTRHSIGPGCRPHMLATRRESGVVLVQVCAALQRVPIDILTTGCEDHDIQAAYGLEAKVYPVGHL